MRPSQKHDWQNLLHSVLVNTFAVQVCSSQGIKLESRIRFTYGYRTNSYNSQNFQPCITYSKANTINFVVNHIENISSKIKLYQKIQYSTHQTINSFSPFNYLYIHRNKLLKPYHILLKCMLMSLLIYYY